MKKKMTEFLEITGLWTTLTVLQLFWGRIMRYVLLVVAMFVVFNFSLTSTVHAQETYVPAPPDNLRIVGGATVLEMYVVNSQIEQLNEIMRGEAFHVIMVLDEQLGTNPTFSISSGASTPIQRNTIVDDELSGNGRVAYMTGLATLESSQNGGSFASVGNGLTTSYGGSQIALPIVAPKINIFVTAPRWLGPRLDKVAADQRIKVEVLIPRYLVGPTEKYKTKVNVEFKAKKTGSNDTLELQNNRNQYGRVRFTHDGYFKLKDGVPGAFVNEMDPIKVDWYDELTLTLVEDNRVKTTVSAFKTETQKAIAILRSNFVFLKDQYSKMVKAPISKASKEALHHKISVAKNAIWIMDHDRRAANDLGWNDWKKLAIGLEYQNLLLSDSSKWSKSPESVWKKNRYNIVMPFLQEQMAELKGWQNAATRIENALNMAENIVVEGTYTTFTTFTGARAASIVFFKHDEFGRRVNTTEQVLAGVETASMFLLTGAMVYKGLVYNRATLSPGACGKQVRFMKRAVTRVKGGGKRAEDWLSEVYGTGRDGGSKKKFLTSAGKGREYDAYDHVQRIPFEAKTGRLIATNKAGQRALKQMKHDVDILKNNAELTRVEWHFFVSQEAMLTAEKKGLSLKDAIKESFGPNKDMLKAFEEANQELRKLGKEIRIVEHDKLVF